MVFYLLPRGTRQKPYSTIRGGKEEFVTHLRDSFPELEDLRLKLIDTLPVDLNSLAPAWRRYASRFWEELCLWAMPERVKKEVEEKGIVLSPLMGIIRAGDPVPLYNAEWKTRVGTRTLYEIWKGRIKEISSQLFKDAVIYDLLTSEERELVDLSTGSLRISFIYLKKGKKLRNTLPHRAYTLRYIVEMKVTPDSLEKINFLDYRVTAIEKSGRNVRVTFDSEGKYL